MFGMNSTGFYQIDEKSGTIAVPLSFL